MRKLATIRKIMEIKPISGADSICAYRVDNWWVVDSIGEYKINDLVIYCEPDSWIPHELAPFLSKGQEPRVYESIKGERLRTVKLRGQISQGLLLPLWDSSSMLVQKFATFENVANRPYPVWVENITEYGWYIMPDGRCVENALFELDLSPSLGILKYEPPVPAHLSGIVKGAFPSSFPRTDEERIQNLTTEWPRLQTYTYEVTEKLEGSSMSVGLIPNGLGFEFIVCSRNLNLKETEDNTLWKIARAYDIEHKLLNTPTTDGIIIQGELCGPGIQGNIYSLKEIDFFVFAVYDISQGRYYSSDQRQALCENIGLKHVPLIIKNHTVSDMSIDDMLELANGKSQLNSNVLREGLVFKRNDKGQEHFKVISNEYLLKNKKN